MASGPTCPKSFAGCATASSECSRIFAWSTHRAGDRSMAGLVADPDSGGDVALHRCVRAGRSTSRSGHFRHLAFLASLPAAECLPIQRPASRNTLGESQLRWRIDRPDHRAAGVPHCPWIEFSRRHDGPACACTRRGGRQPRSVSCRWSARAALPAQARHHQAGADDRQARVPLLRFATARMGAPILGRLSDSQTIFPRRNRLGAPCPRTTRARRCCVRSSKACRRVGL